MANPARRACPGLAQSAACIAILIAMHALYANARAADWPANEVSSTGSPATGAPVVSPDDEPLRREIFVPFEDLHVILSSDAQRVFVTREEYEALAAKAKVVARPGRHEQPAAVLSADYVATIEETRARLVGTLVVTAPDDALSSVTLDLSGVALRTATLDGKAAALGRNLTDLPVLFVSGAGRHELKLEILAPLETAAAQRTLSFQIPTPPATRFKLTVPGNVEIKSGATIIRRDVDERPATTFDLLPRHGQNSLVLTLNNHQLRKESVIVAHSVLIDEITSAFERLYVTESLSMLHGAAEQFRFALPEGFEVTSVSGAQVARWAITRDNSQRILDVGLREPATDTVSLNISAIRTPVALSEWRLPKLVVMDVAGQAAVVGLLVESRLKPYGLQPTNLIPIDNGALSQSLPAGLTENRAGEPALVTVATFYAPHGDYDLKAHFAPPPTELRVATNVLLTLTEAKLEAHGGFALSNVTDKLLGFDFSAPPGWQVTELKLVGGVALTPELYPLNHGGTRIHVRLPNATPLGRSRNVYFHAVSTPDSWLDEWSSKRVEFPVFQVAGAMRDGGALAVQSQDDMLARADQVARLTPLDANDKSKFGLDNVTTELAYRYEEPPYTLTLAVTRVEPRLTARVFSFFRVEPDLLMAHYEIAYSVAEARTGRLVFALPANTPAELAIQGLDGQTIKESSSVVKGEQREWTVLLDQSRRGTVRLAVDFQQPLGERGKQAPGKDNEKAAQPTTDITLPLVRALHVAYQTGMVAVEESSESDVQLKTTLRKVDVGRLAEADYQPGQRLLGAFGYGGDEAEVKIAIARPAGYELPTAIVERAELLTMISASGRSQTAARFQLRCKAQLIDVRLPSGSTLWSAYLDGKPTQPQREANSVLIELPAEAEARRRNLQLVYETPINTLGMASNLELAAPKLRLRAKGSSTGDEVPLADLVWQLSTPYGFKVVRNNGTVFSEDIAVRESPLAGVADAFSDVFSPFSSVKSAREAAREGISSKDDKSAAMPAIATSAAPATDIESSSLVGLAAGNSKQYQHFAQDDDRRFLGKEVRTKHLNDIVSIAKSPQGSSKLAVEENAPLAYAAPSFAEPFLDQSGGGKGDKNKRSLWALEGVRSLPIDFEPGQIQTTFQSLGEEPRLNVMAVDRERFELLGWCVGLVVFLRGVTMTCAPLRRRFRFVAVTLVVSFVLPLAVPWTGLISPLCNMAFYAACWLAVYYLIASIVKRIVRFGQGATRQMSRGKAAVASLGLLTLLARAAPAEDPPAPLAVPPDAIIVPYDPAKQDPLKGLETPSADVKPGGEKHEGKAFGTDKSQKLLVPYKKYLALQRAAHPDEIAKLAAPAEYALVGGQFTARLDGGESLLIEGHFDVDVLVDHAVSIPLPLGGGMLTKAEVDGKPGAAGAFTDFDSPHRRDDEKSQTSFSRPVESHLALLVSGAGRRHIELAIRFALERRGGWQIAEGRLPTPPATALRLDVGKAGTEVTLSGGVDHGTFETKRDNETIETALAADGTFRLQWRAKAGPAPVDQGLAVRDTVRFDVQEGGLRLVWRLDLEFRRGQRESFTIDIPDGYLVEKVTGGNVRGWNVKEAGGLRKLEVTLLKAAQDTESFSVALSRRGAVGSGELAELAAPVLSVEGATQQSGELTIRSSPRLELRIQSAGGASRADGDGLQANVNDDSDDSPLGIVPFQVYRFATTPFTIKLSARPVVPHVTAELQTVLRISEQQRSMESRIRLRVDGRPIYRLRISLPEDLRVDRVSAPEPFQWVVDRQGQHRLLSLYFAAGQRQPFDLLLAGILGKYGAVEAVPAPRLEIIDADEQAGSIEQSGDIAVEADPSLEVRAEKLVHCETELIERVNTWLNPAQQRLARLALRYRTPDFAVQLQLSPRKPLVHCDTFANIRVNERTVQETILLNFTISEAGIRSLSFVLPESMRGARISAPMLRQKTVEQAGDGATDRVRVRIELQEEVMGSLRVLVENDRLLSSDKYAVPAPVVETGQTDHRYITLESAGRDEIVIDAKEGVDPIGQEQTEWRMLSGMLGRGLTQAYLVRPGVAQPLLTLHAQDRAAVETAGARIGLARALLIVDANGAYRGAQLYRVDNSLEQYLEIQLPSGARLWTAHVAGEPVKPAVGKAASAGGDVVRIPLIKTARGDADYEVLLKYGGQLGRLRALDHVEFPLIHTVNVHVELSQVELDVPETYDWFDFGGTMRRVQSEGDLAAGWLSYNTKQISLAKQALQSGDPFARTRAEHNLKILQAESESLKQSAQQYRGNSDVEQQFQTNSSIQVGIGVNSDAGLVGNSTESLIDNRTRLGGFYKSQSNARANDVINSAGTNFSNNVTFQQGSFTGGNATSPALPGGATTTGKETPSGEVSGDKRGQKQGAGVNSDAGLVGDISMDAPLPQLPDAVRGGGQRFGQAGAADPSQAVDNFDQFASEPEFRESGGGVAPRNNLQRYSIRLEQKAENRGTSNIANGGTGQGGGFASPDGFNDRDGERTVLQYDVTAGRKDIGKPQPGEPKRANSPAGKPAAPAVLASLDVELHPRGVRYLFTTPRGDAEVTARAVSDSLLGRLIRLAELTVALLVLLVLVAAVRRRHAARFNSHIKASSDLKPGPESGAIG